MTTERWSLLHGRSGLWWTFLGAAAAMLLACGESDADVPSTSDGGSDDADAGVRDCFDYASPAEACRERPDCRARIAASDPYFIGSGATTGCTFDTPLEKCARMDGTRCLGGQGTCYLSVMDCFLPEQAEFYKKCGLAITGVCWPDRDGGP